MRKLLVGTDMLRFVAGNRDRIDALAFAIMIKQERINSTITGTSQRNLKKIFHMGSDTLRRVIENGMKYGFLRREGNRIIANKICRNKKLGYNIKRSFFVEAKHRNGSHLTLSNVRTIVEEAIIVNQISMQQSCADTHDRATDGHTRKSVRDARKRESRMLKQPYCDGYTGLSNLRIQQLIGRKHGKAVKVVKQAIIHKLVSKRIRMTEFNVPGETYSPVMRAMMQGTNIIVWVENRCARIRLSNEYRYINNNIKIVNHGQ